MQQLTQIAQSDPHAAYTASTHGLSSHWLYTSRTTPSISYLLQPLEDIITNHLFPALTGNVPFDDYTQAPLALPPKWGGIGLTNPTDLPTLEYLASCKITQPLNDIILSNVTHFDLSVYDQQLRQRTAVSRMKKDHFAIVSSNLHVYLSSRLRRSVKLATEKGASSWLSALPLSNSLFYIRQLFVMLLL